MKGTRVDNPPGLLKPGEFGKIDGTWHAQPPWKHGCANLAAHEVIEQPDGTITVRPSILVTSHDNGVEVKWHGYLERGVWREC